MSLGLKESQTRCPPNSIIFFLQFKSLKFQTWSKKSKNDINRQFIDRKSRIERFSDQPFFAHWRNGHIENLYASSANSLTEENFKKGIAGLFQVRKK